MSSQHNSPDIKSDLSVFHVHTMLLIGMLFYSASSHVKKSLYEFSSSFLNIFKLCVVLATET